LTIFSSSNAKGPVVTVDSGTEAIGVEYNGVRASLSAAEWLALAKPQSPSKKRPRDASSDDN